MAMLTEDEARTKACCGTPALAFATLAASTWARGDEVQLAPGRTDGGHCIASGCMAWRLGEPDYAAMEIVADRERALLDGPQSSNPASAEIPRKGYCGLAGKP
jgi:hypothetical protein